MEFSAIYHRAADNYCYALDDERLVINLQTGFDVKSVNLICGDPFQNGLLGGGENWEGKAVSMTSGRRLEHHLLWTIVVKPPFKRLKYYFELKSGDEVWYCLEDGIMSEEQMRVKGRFRQCFVMPWMNPCDVNRVPDWVKDTVWYQIFPERFCNGDPSINPEGVCAWKNQGTVTNQEFYGGDLKGIESRLDDMKGLGINGIYMTPINEADTSHKYDTRDYRKIDPQFGDAETFKHLVSEAHQRGIRVMIDGVFNHTGQEFAPWKDVVAKGPKSEYYDWFMINEWPFEPGAAQKNQFYSFAFFDDMPKLNTGNPKVRAYLIDICEEWIRRYDIDGIRLDVGNEISHLFCKELRTRLKAVKSEFFLLGEIWHDSMAWLRGDEYDSVMNYPLGQGIRNFWLDSTQTTVDFECMVNRNFSRYMEQTNDVIFNLLDSHDTKRLRSQCDSFDEFLQNLAILFTMPGSPCIYYGTEIAMEGDYDPDCRRCMPWEEIEAGTYDEIKELVSGLIHLRRKEKLCKGHTLDFLHHTEHPRVIDYRKNDSDGCMEVILNCEKEPFEITEKAEILYRYKCSDETVLPGGILICKTKEW